MTLKLDVRNDFGLSMFSVDEGGKIIFEPFDQNIGIKNTNPQRTLDITGDLGVDELFIDGANENSVLVVGANSSIIANSSLEFDGTALTMGANSARAVVSDTTLAGANTATVSNIVTVSQSDYDALVAANTVNADTVYIIE